MKNIIDAFITKPNKEIETIFMITLKEVDKEGKGIIKFNEFCELMTKIQWLILIFFLCKDIFFIK